MTDKKRPWYLRKTEIGVILTIVGEVLVFVPVTAPYAPVVIKIGSLLAGIGVAHRNIKEKK